MEDRNIESVPCICDKLNENSKNWIKKVKWKKNCYIFQMTVKGTDHLLLSNFSVKLTIYRQCSELNSHMNIGR